MNSYTLPSEENNITSSGTTDELKTKKRTFSVHQPTLSKMMNNAMATESNKVNNEAAPQLLCCVDNGDDDDDGAIPSSKRTRRGSRPMLDKAEVAEAVVDNNSATNKLPIITADINSSSSRNAVVVLPDPKETKVAPDDYLLLLVKAQHGVSLQVRKGLELANDDKDKDDDRYFPSITEEQQAAYTMEVLTPARDNNVQALKELVAAKGRRAVDCVNRFGESLLNLACRRGFIEVAEYLLSDEIGLCVRMKDDFGRTPFHDACWHPNPQLDICSWLLERDPSLLLVADKRGNTPFMYARPEDWPTWRQFLFDHRGSLTLLTEPTTLKRFGVGSGCGDC